MKLKINSRKLNRTVEFTRPGSEYIYVDLSGGNPGTLGQQICHSGGLTGATMMYGGESEAEFKKICRNWFRLHIKED